MFVQIVDWLTKFITILSDAQKLTTSSNRRAIGQWLVQFHSLISHIVDNATDIRAALLQLQREFVSENGRNWGVDYRPLIRRLGDQRQLLNTLQGMLRKHRELLDIYGNNCAREIERVTSFKVSLIDLINVFALHAAYNIEWGDDRPDRRFIPTTFDLADLAAFRQVDTESYDYQEVLFSDARQFFAKELGKDPSHDALLVESLMRQVDATQTIEKLSRARETIADILKAHFRIDELF